MIKKLYIWKFYKYAVENENVYKHKFVNSYF